MPKGIRGTLGYGLKHCIKLPQPQTIIYEKPNPDLPRLRNDIGRIYTYLDEEDVAGNYNPKLYINSDTPFDINCAYLENQINAFVKEFSSTRRRYLKRTAPNLTNKQFRLISDMKNNTIYIIIEADKNLGPCILEREHYIRRAFEEHLGNERNYKIITKAEAIQLQMDLAADLEIWLVNFSKEIPLHERTFLRRAKNKYSDQLAKFRMTLKAHKNPYKFRPIVCCAGTWMNSWSKWLDFHLQKLKPFVPTYVRDTSHILEELKLINDLSPGSWIVVADADAMYNNIDTAHAILILEAWLDELSLSPDFPTDFPLGAVKSAMKTIMTNNHFEFGDLNFLQLLGTAMGTSAAVMWATLYFAYHEVKCLLPKYKQFFYKGRLRRFIDDMFFIWNCNECSHWRTCHHWRNFKSDLNRFGVLKWTVNDPAKRGTFLDLDIRIEGSRIITRTYQKPMNLYLYLAGSSAHPQGVVKGTIYGLLRRYHEQNTFYSDYLHFASLLYRRLLDRGHQKKDIRPIFIEAHSRIRAAAKSPATEPTEAPSDITASASKRLFLHIENHPCDIPRSEIRRIWEKHCHRLEKYLGVPPMTIAYHRPKNIGDHVTKAKLFEAPGRTASYYMGEYKQGLAP